MLTITNNAIFQAGQTFMAYDSGSTSTVNQASSGAQFIATSTLQMYPGTAGGLQSSNYAPSLATMNIMGGSNTVRGIILGTRGSNYTAILNVSGGSLYANGLGLGNANYGLILVGCPTNTPGRPSTGTLTIGQGGLVVATGDVSVMTNGTGKINLNSGGTLHIGAYALGAAGAWPSTTDVGSLQGGTNDFVNNGRLVFARFGTNWVHSGVISGTGSVTEFSFSNNVIILTASNTYSGDTIVSNACVQLGNGGAQGSINSSSGVLLWNGGRLAFNHSDDIRFPVAISGNGGLLQFGSGRVTLSATNTHIGSTTVSNGTLALAASASIGSSSNILVNSGAFLDVSSVSGGFVLDAAQTLRGNGTVTGPVAVNGTLACGMTNTTQGMGSLTLSNSPVLGGRVFMKINRTNSPATSDLLAVSGPLTYGGNLTVTNFGPALVGGDEFTLFSATGLSGSFSTTNLPTLTTSSNFNWWLGALPASGKIVVNRPPTANSVTNSRSAGAPLTILISNLMSGAADPDIGDSAAFGSLVSTGTQGATITTNGSGFVYQLAANTNDTLTFSVIDSRGGLVIRTNRIVVVASTTTVTQSNLAQTYDGAAKPVTVTTVPVNLAVAVTYNGSASVPTNAGSYTVVARSTDPFYIGAATNTLVISRAATTVALGNLAQAYDGAAKPVSVTTSMTNVTVALAYNGSANAPTNSGSYTVVATVTDANHTGGTTNTLVISPAAATVALGNLAQAYDGAAKPVTVTTSPTNLTVAVTYNGSADAPTNGGSYTVIATVTDANHTGGTTNTLVISPAAATVALGNLAQAYDGAAKPVTVTTSPTNLTVAVTYNGSADAPTNAGSYTVIATVTDANYAGGATNALVIAQAGQTVAFGALPLCVVGDAPFTLTALASSGLPVSYVSSDPSVASVTGNTVSILSAGSSTITASQSGNGNYLATNSIQPLLVTNLVVDLSISRYTNDFYSVTNVVYVDKNSLYVTNVINIYPNIVLTISGNQDRAYNLQYQDDLTQTNWQLLQAITNLPAPIYQVIETPTNAARFYRVQRPVWTPN